MEATHQLQYLRSYYEYAGLDNLLLNQLKYVKKQLQTTSFFSMNTKVKETQ